MGRKNVIIIALSLMLVVAVTVAAGAQMAYRMGGVRHRAQVGAARIAAGLQLTDAQKEQAREIFQQAKKDVQAVLTPEQRERIAQARRTGPRQRMHDRRDRIEQALNLTPEQKEKMKAIHQDARSQIEAVKKDAELSRQDRIAKLRAIHRSVMEQMKQILTPEQQQQIRQRFEQRKQRGPAGALKLTPEQQAQMKAIREKAQAQFRGMLTREQQQQLDQHRQRMQGRVERFRQQRQPEPAVK